MNQKSKNEGIRPLKMLIFVGIVFAVFLVSELIFSFFLMKMNHFEQYYQAVTVLATLICALCISLLSGKEKGTSLAICAIVSLGFSLVCICVGLFVSGKEFHFLAVLLRFLLLVVFSMAFTLFWNRNKKKRVGRKRNLKFKK